MSLSAPNDATPASVPSSNDAQSPSIVGDAARDSVESNALRTTKSIAHGLYHKAFGEIVILGIAVAVGAIPLFHEYGLLVAAWWLWLWLALYLAQQVQERYHRGKAREGEARRIARIHGSVAGSVDSIAKKVMAAGDYRIDHEETRALAVGLLHRIKDYACCVLPKADDAGLRVTLAVPIYANGREQLRVWCYDQTYADRQWTTLPLPGPDEQPLPGSPAAFKSNRIQIIRDIWSIAGVHAFRGKTFRSVLSMPINAGGPSEACVAVLNMDATEPSYFEIDLIERELYPLVGPALSLLGLVLLLRRKGVDYEFGS